MISQLYAKISAPVKRILFLMVSSIKIREKQKTIHIVRLDAIGDFVLFSAILPYFRKVYPGYTIVLIIDEVVLGMAQWLNDQRVLGEAQNGYFDEVIAINGKDYNRNFFYYYKMLKKIRLSAPEIVIQPTFSRTVKSDDIVFISKEAKKIAYQGDISNISIVNKAKNDARYDHLIKNPAHLSEPNTNKHFLNELAGFEILTSGVPVWHLSETLQDAAKKRLESLGINLAKPVVAICPGSSRAVKNWPVENFISLLQKISKYKPELQFMLIGGPKEKELSDYIEKNSGIKGVYDVCGQFNLPELVGVLSLTALYIGNDTGAMHMASAVGVSTIGIMSGEHGVRFFPYVASLQGAKNTAIFSKVGGISDPLLNMKSITVDDVFSEVVKNIPRQGT